MRCIMRLVILVTLALRPETGMGGRAQRKQRLAEERLRPYLGRVSPEDLCDVMTCHSPIGSWCQVVTDGSGALVPKCVCPQTCPRRGAPVCSALGKTYASECLLRKESCRKRRRTGIAHTGPCVVPREVCTDIELGQFPYRLLDWFLLLSRMGGSHASAPPPQSCLSHAQRTALAQRWFAQLDRNGDGKLSRRDLRKLRYKQMPLERCARRFLRSCDSDRNRKVTLQEWTGCLVDRSERWFQDFMSVKMGSHKLCPVSIPRL
ncbi:SPARC isoform X1 [Conger conger]|uniref:SPARC isoform X1 n=1 Tax=Conger conger TaxID=82655 RepID=UPI002A5AB21F|nr:SPARC isoform X1 [Conger conger]